MPWQHISFLQQELGDRVQSSVRPAVTAEAFCKHPDWLSPKLCHSCFNYVFVLQEDFAHSYTKRSWIVLWTLEVLCPVKLPTAISDIVPSERHLAKVLPRTRLKTIQIAQEFIIAIQPCALLTVCTIILQTITHKCSLGWLKICSQAWECGSTQNHCKLSIPNSKNLVCAILELTYPLSPPVHSPWFLHGVIQIHKSPKRSVLQSSLARKSQTWLVAQYFQNHISRNQTL